MWSEKSERLGIRQMLRGIGGSMILIGCLGLGLWYKKQLTGRVRNLRLLEHILELLASEVRFGRATLPECCEHVSAQVSEPFSEALGQVAERMLENDGVTFDAVFRECMEETLRSMPLKPQDRENFYAFLSTIGYADRQMQLRAMEHGCELMAGTIEKLERDNAEKCRMAIGLGAMGGLLLILVLW